MEYKEIQSQPVVGEEETVPPIFVLFTFVLIVLLQFSIQLWKKHHRKSYILTTFVLMWIFPIAFILLFSPSIASYVRMLVIWMIYTCVTAWIFYLSFQKKLSKNTPKKVYAWFLLIYQLSHLATMIGGVTFVIDLFSGIFSRFVHGVLRDIRVLEFFFPLPHILLFYGLYYGVLVRDCAEMCADAMSNSMTKERSQFYLSQSVVDTTCGICNLPLKDLDRNIATSFGNLPPSSNTDIDVESASEYFDAEALPPQQPAVSSGHQPQQGKKKSAQPTQALSACGHKFHEFCLRGWMLVGKKDVCPFCGEKIAFNEVSKHTKQPWQSDSELFIQVLELVRYVLVWNPIIVFAIHVVFVLYVFIHHH